MIGWDILLQKLVSAVTTAKTDMTFNVAPRYLAINSSEWGKTAPQAFKVFTLSVGLGTFRDNSFFHYTVVTKFVLFFVIIKAELNYLMHYICWFVHIDLFSY